MTTICHGNFTLHRLLTDQGACIHTHHPESFEDTGDAESGPCLEGGPAYDEYTSDSHYMIVDQTGLFVHSQVIDWDMERFVDEMTGSGVDEFEARETYKPKRREGEDWAVRYRDEDGSWFLQRGACWSQQDMHPFSIAEAEQRAHAFNQLPHDRIVGRAVVIPYREKK